MKKVSAKKKVSVKAKKLNTEQCIELDFLLNEFLKIVEKTCLVKSVSVEKIAKEYMGRSIEKYPDLLISNIEIVWRSKNE